MPGYYVLATLAACVLIQSAFPSRLEIAGTHPDLVLILMCYLAVIDRRRSVIWIAFCAGLVQDTFSGYPLGINALSKGIIVLAIQGSRVSGSRFLAKEWPKVVAAACLGDGVLTLLMVRVLSSYHMHPATILVTLAASALYTTASSVPAPLLLSRLERRAVPEYGRTSGGR